MGSNLAGHALPLLGTSRVLYIGDDFEGAYEMRDDLARPLWHRRIMLRPDIDDWWIWQVHAHASIAGIDGGADLNVMRGEAPHPSHRALTERRGRGHGPRATSPGALRGVRPHRLRAG